MESRIFRVLQEDSARHARVSPLGCKVNVYDDQSGDYLHGEERFFSQQALSRNTKIFALMEAKY